MKAIIEFNLSESDDALDYKRVNKSLDMALALWEIAYNTRKKIHYQLDANVYDKYNAVDLVFEKISEILNEHNINLDEIIV